MAECPTCGQVPPCEHLDEEFLAVWEVIQTEHGPALAALAAYDRGEEITFVGTEAAAGRIAQLKAKIAQLRAEREHDGAVESEGSGSLE